MVRKARKITKTSQSTIPNFAKMTLISSKARNFNCGPDLVDGNRSIEQRLTLQLNTCCVMPTQMGQILLEPLGTEGFLGV